jgi:O-antigen/teichoic acid export membrane protein
MILLGWLEVKIMGYLKTAFRGISWMAGLRVIVRILGLVKIGVLARILLPAQFGIYGIATLVLGLLETLTETGINIFLIQLKDKVDEYIDSSWVVSIIRGILIGLIIFLCIPLITSFFGAPSARSILLLVCFVPVIRGFINPAVIKYQKNLQFKKQFYYDSFLFFVEAVVAISLGIITKSENSLVWSMIISAGIEVIISFAIFSPRPRFIFEKEKTLRVINRGKWITGAGIFNYLFQNLDDIFVGKLLGSAPLGIYQQAYKISSLPVSEVGEIFNRVTFPIYATIQEDKIRLRQAFLKTLLVISLLVIPFGLAIFYYPQEIIILALGVNWLSAVGVLQLLAIFGVIKAIANSFFSLFLGIGKQEIVTLITFVASLVMAAIVYPLIKIFGLLGAGYAAIISTLATIPVVVYYFWKYFYAESK